MDEVLNGDSDMPGWRTDLKALKSELDEIESKIRDAGSSVSSSTPEGLHRERRYLEGRVFGRADDIACLQRLVTDTRMRDVYERLVADGEDGERIREFIHAANTAHIDFAPHRDAIRSAQVLTQEIAATAATLADLLGRYERTGLACPDEFFSVPSLLEVASPGKRNQAVWPRMRRHILGNEQGTGCNTDEPTEDDGRELDDLDEIMPILVEHSSGSPEPAALQRYAWSIAPDVASIITVLAAAAKDFTPGEYRMVGAAVSPRQHSPKTECLRAFGHLLIEDLGFELSSTLRHAIAMTATVAINDSMMVVSYDDVRKALG